MTKLISLKVWDNFPRITPKYYNEDYADKIEWNGIEIKVGDEVIWQENQEGGGIKFVINDIRLYPTLRFWSDKEGGWFLAYNCSLLK